MFSKCWIRSTRSWKQGSHSKVVEAPCPGIPPQAKPIVTERKTTLGELIPSVLALSALFYFSVSGDADAMGAFDDSQDIFGGAGNADDYIYSTKDLAVDLASPLVAYKVVSSVLKQEVPDWLNYIIYAFVAVAIWVCVADVTDLDAYLS
ncbi:hypothetical protein CYMTET_12506 [Cymbomonas tetramitiformis]|uniref:Uncharacterized protein n=1 Tax=Cymbomonas tetramitiformis TaxID=36881 RepID=A0AAE0GJW7_9CHLO|nr:hypothetical protein CYMTET_12506 [Cymbomonas tetramitiformis]